MNRAVACCVLTLVLGSGCDDVAAVPPLPPDGSATDLAVSDQSVTASDDLAVLTITDALTSPPDSSAGYLTTTIHAIDIGLVATGSSVRIPNAVVVGVANSVGHDKLTMRCNYDAWVEDASGAPSGIMLFAVGAVCTQDASDAGTSICQCHLPPNSGTPLDQLMTPGDVFDLLGTTHTSGGAHEIDTPTLTLTASGMPVTPVTISDAPTIASLALNGTGYVSYEGMLVTIKAASAMPTTAFDNFGDFQFGGAQFSGDYNFAYSKTITQGAKWSSITGVVEPAFGGGIAPRQASDFAP